MFEHRPMAHHVVAKVHRHEARELQEARIDAAPGARIPGGNGDDDIFLEPGVRARHRMLVDRGRRLARVDRPAHHRQRRGAALVLVRRHDRRGGEARHRRLAHRQHMRAGTDMLEPRNQIVDVIVEIELARRQRCIARVAPVGDPHIMAGQHALDRAAQQRRIMARHRRDDQQLGGALRPLVGEMLELAERLARLDLLAHPHRFAVDDRLIQFEPRLAARCRGVREHLQRRCELRAATEIAERVRGVLHHLRPRGRERARASEPALLHFKGVIQHIDFLAWPRALCRRLIVASQSRRSVLLCNAS